ncbi:MAG TPA: hypothetical protein VFR16_12385 [Agromyces mariniharenae]|nr:hypothetical protein [Agromyces mariniharenae]
MSERHPELEPDPFDEAPMPGERRRKMLRVAVLVALAAMVLPLVLSSVAVAHSSAERTCAAVVAAYDTDAAGGRVAFEFFGPGGPGWLCYEVRDDGGSRLVANLGIMPSGPRPAPTGVRT